MVKYKIKLSKQASSDRALLKATKLEVKIREILNHMADNPFYFPPECKALEGNLHGFYSRRINIKHRLVYSVDEDNKTIKILRLLTHYEE